MARFDQATVFILVLVFDDGPLEGGRQTGRVDGDSGRDFFEADPACSSRICP
jgi:hypothetical protein